MSSSIAIFNHRASDIPASGLQFTTKEIYYLLQWWTIRMEDVGEEILSEVINEANAYFAAHNKLSEKNLVSIKTALDAVKLFNMNYIAFGGAQIVQLLKCYHHVGDPLKACNVWIYNEEDVFDEMNRYGLNIEDCV